ncbi:hypothetical protein M2451_002568 [Dysgonomonas sp. PFB1-18]|uniref:hypothetical protein n=1 Tax=unclassified Dysgonomonas TaxID=2630389 RepID=UPI0024733BCB|nr:MULTISPECIES: hypothetical protein [unclassified Dysgonomonas]MDH6308049.1 hypothetical protein [Dysgonomonas sp. PF1-14]MDH6339588.1 hypothetical protein [Dysgonomonas sp. PF1-16]MDH6381239.1 hypothetical protein [Dysgonomonas sp. PFB1-18]MDH6398451.1 hypothetical protein [Dysgonomonas sp. PF1-23]
MGLLLGSGSTKPQYPYDMWYGVQGDFTSRDYKLTRVGNLDLHKTLPIQKKIKRFVENPDGSVKYYLHQNDSRKKESGAAAILDSTDGNVMLEKPEYYFRLEIDGTKWLRAWSEYPLPGFTKMERKSISPWYATIDITNSVAVSGCWLTWAGDNIARDANGIVILTANAAQFRGGSGAGDAAKDGTYNSQLGMARTSISKAGVRPLCKNGTHHGAYRAYNELAWLQRCEYASLHCQDTYNETLTSEGYKQGGLGSGSVVAGGEWNTWGAYKPFVPCGTTATLGNNTGKVAYTIKGWTGGDKTVQVTSYRGLEVPFEYLYMLADDVLIYHGADRSTAYVCEDPSKFTSHSDSSTAVPVGYDPISDLPRTNGYILQLTHSAKTYSFPETVGGAANAGGCDYYYQPVTDGGSGWYGALLSANASSGASAGFGFLNTLNRSSYSYAYVGFRLCRF